MPCVLRVSIGSWNRFLNTYRFELNHNAVSCIGEMVLSFIKLNTMLVHTLQAAHVCGMHCACYLHAWFEHGCLSILFKTDFLSRPHPWTGMVGSTTTAACVLKTEILQFRDMASQCGTMPYTVSSYYWWARVIEDNSLLQQCFSFVAQVWCCQPRTNWAVLIYYLDLKY